MNDAIRHRGPDGDGFHFEPDFALAIAGLPSSTSTPAPSRCSRKAAKCDLFNGEIYNYRELRES